MKSIKIQNSNLIFIVADEDYDRLVIYDWYLSGRNHTQIRRFNSNNFFSLPNEIMQSKEMFDHKDRNFLNNQKDNLRVCTASQNGANRSKLDIFSSKYKGVSYCQRDTVWRAYVMYRKKSIALGTFSTPELAAKRYNIEAVKIWGEFAVLNKIEKV